MIYCFDQYLIYYILLQSKVGIKLLTWTNIIQEEYIRFKVGDGHLSVHISVIINGVLGNVTINTWVYNAVGKIATNARTQIDIMIATIFEN